MKGRKVDEMRFDCKRAQQGDCDGDLHAGRNQCRHRLAHSRAGHDAGVVLVWNGEAYGWKNTLRDAAHERPGVLAVDAEGNVYRAEGGNDQAGARAWVVAT